MHSHPRFATPVPNLLPPNKKGGGAPRDAGRKDRIIKRCGAHPYSRPPRCAGGPRPDPDRARPHGAGALAFRRPTAALTEVFSLGSAWAALPGITGCKREDPLRHQCSEHLAVRHVPDGTMPKPPVSAVYRCTPENRPRSASRSTLASGVLHRAGFWLSNRCGDKSQAWCPYIRETLRGQIRITSAASRPHDSVGAGLVPAQERTRPGAGLAERGRPQGPPLR
jgi:hypothetical protein